MMGKAKNTLVLNATQSKKTTIDNRMINKRS